MLIVRTCDTQLADHWLQSALHYQTYYDVTDAIVAVLRCHAMQPIRWWRKSNYI